MRTQTDIEEIAPLPPRFTKRSKIIAAIATIAIVTVIAITNGSTLLDIWQAGIIRTLLYSGPPRSAQKLLDNLPEASRKKISDLKVYIIDDVINEIYLWRFECPQEVFNALRDRNSLIVVPQDQVNDNFFDGPPRWWNPIRKANVEFVSTKSGEVMIMYDKDTNVVYGSYDLIF